MIDGTQFPQRRLDVSALSCQRGVSMLFSNLSFSVTPGTVLLVRGANGAGKTSLLMCLAGVIRPSAGEIVFSGRNDEDGPDLGLLFYGSGIKPRLTIAENLSFWAALEGGNPELIETVLDEVGLGGLGGLYAGYLSSGQSRRLAIARLLLANRPIWLLDEPTAALDEAGEVLVQTLIDRQLDRGGLVIAATHHDLSLKNIDRAQSLTLGGRS
jgi:heme exporter protein A